MDEENIGGIKFTVNADYSSVYKATESMKRMQAAAVTASAALVGMTAVVADQVKEADNWSKALGITTTELQQLQAAAQKVGLDADKMGDILKDVNEKIGEAFVDGGGEGAEALKLLGLQVENIIDLPVDEKLKVIGDALQDIEGVASRSAIGEMLASDFTLILPLLEDGNAGLEEMMQRAMETGQALSSFDNTALIEVSKGFQSVTDNAKGSVNILSAKFAPIIILAQEKIGNMIDAFKADDIESFVSFGVDAIGILADAVKTLEIALRTIGVAWAYIASQATGAMAASAEAVADLINLALTPLREAISAVAEGWGLVAEGISKVTTGEVSARFKSASDALKQFSKESSAFRVKSEDIKSANDAVNKSLAEQIKELDTLAKSPAYSDQFRQRIEEIKKEIQAKAEATDKDREASNKLSNQNKQTLKETEDLANETARLAKENEKSAQRFKDLVNPVRVIQREYSEARKLFEKGLITKEEFDATKKRLGELAANIGKENREKWQQSGADAAGFFSESFADGIQSAAFSGGIEGAFDYLGSQLGQKVSDAVSKSVSDSVSSSIGNAAGGAIGGLAGGLVGGGVASLIGGLFGGSKKTKLSAGFEFEIVDSQIAEAFSTERIKRSSIFGSSTREYKTAVSDVTQQIIQNTFTETGRELSDAAAVFGVEAQSFSGTIKLENGSLTETISLANEESAQALFGASEDWAVAGQSALSVLQQLADDARTVNASFMTIGADASGIIAETSAQLTSDYDQQFADLMQRRIEVSERDSELIELIGGQYSRKAAIQAGVQKELSALYKESQDLDVQLAELSTRSASAMIEATATFNDALLESVAEFENISIDAAGSKLIEQSQLYAERFFTAEEIAAKAVEDALTDLSRFEDIGVDASTSLAELRFQIELFKDSEAFSAEGLAKYLSAAEAVVEYSDAVKNQQDVLNNAALSAELALLSTDFAIQSLNNSIANISTGGTSTGTVGKTTKQLADTDLDQVFSDIKSEFADMSDLIGEITTDTEALKEAFANAVDIDEAVSVDADAIFADIVSEFDDISDAVGGITMNIVDMRKQFDAARTAGDELVKPADAVGKQIAQIYSDVLDRLPDAAGLEYWSAQVESGALTIDQVFESISESAEAQDFSRFKDLADSIAEYNTLLEASGAGPTERFNELLNTINAYNNLSSEVEKAKDIIAQTDAIKDNTDAIKDNAGAYDDSARILAQQNSLLLEYNRLGTELAELTGDQALETESLAAIREIEIANIDATNIGLFESIEAREKEIKAIEENNRKLEEFRDTLDSKVTSAITAAQKAIDAESDKIYDSYQMQIDAITAASEAEDELSAQRIEEAKANTAATRDNIANLRELQSLLSSSKKNVRATGSIESQQSASAAISQIIASGVLPSADELEPLLDRLTEISEDQFSTQEDFLIAQAKAAGQIKELESKAGAQLTVEERTLESQDALLEEIERSNDERDEALQKQIDLLEDQRDKEIEANQSQLDALLGIDDSVKSVANALSDLKALMQSQQASAQPIVVPSGNIVSQTASGGGVSTIFKNAGGATGVIDTGAFGRGGTSASITIDPETDEIIAATGLPGFASGGMTGGRAGEVRGFVHGQEAVLNPRATANMGSAAVNALNSGVNPADLYRQSVTIDVSSIVNRISGLELTISNLLTQISITSSETASIMDDFQSGEGIRINTSDGEDPVAVNQV